MKILILDDDKDTVEILTSFIETHFSEYTEIYATTDVEKALGVADSHIIDLCFLDVVMPLMDGYDFMRLMNGKLKMVCFISGFEYDELRLNEEEREKSTFMHKPVQPQNIIDATQAAMEAWMLTDIIKSLRETREYCDSLK